MFPLEAGTGCGLTDVYRRALSGWYFEWRHSACSVRLEQNFKLYLDELASPKQYRSCAILTASVEGHILLLFEPRNIVPGSKHQATITSLCS
jgi:hypothetical protein